MPPARHARDIAMNQVIKDKPQLLAAAKNGEPTEMVSPTSASRVGWERRKALARAASIVLR